MKKELPRVKKRLPQEAQVRIRKGGAQEDRKKKASGRASAKKLLKHEDWRHL